MSRRSTRLTPGPAAAPAPATAAASTARRARRRPIVIESDSDQDAGPPDAESSDSDGKDTPRNGRSSLQSKQLVSSRPSAPLRGARRPAPSPLFDDGADDDVMVINSHSDDPSVIALSSSSESDKEEAEQEEEDKDDAYNDSPPPLPPPSRRRRARPASSDSEDAEEPPPKKPRRTAEISPPRPSSAAAAGKSTTQRRAVMKPARPVKRQAWIFSDIDNDDDNGDDAVAINGNSLASTLDLEHFGQGISRLFQIGDMSRFELKPDHAMRPLWVYGDGRIILEAFSPIAEHAQDFLIAVSEPVTRPMRMHEYRLTEYSLYAAVSVGLETDAIIEVLNRLSKSALPAAVSDFVREHTARCGKVKLVLKKNRYWIESADETVLRLLLRDKEVRQARILGGGIDDQDDDNGDEDGLITERAPDAEGLTFPGFSLHGPKDEPEEKAAKPPAAPSKAALRPEEPSLGEGFFHSDDMDDRDADADADAAARAAAESSLQGIDLFDLFDDCDPSADDSDIDRPAAAPQSPPPLPKPPVTASKGNDPATTTFTSVITVDQVDEAPESPTANFYATLTDKAQQQAPFPPATVRTFEIAKPAVDTVKRRCAELSYPTLEEYDFRQDARNPDLDIDLRASTRLRPYQEKSLSKMFGNGRARSGIIVLPCGAGKTLVGVTAACTIKKSCLVLCTSSVSVEQWAREFRTWSTVKEGQVAKFTQNEKETFVGDAGIMISTYTMMSFSGKRAYDAQQILDFITSREWGFLLLDEVHVVPAEMFRKVLTIAAAHAKLGLTATLVREDDKIGNLNYLIGPKLYEANWMDLARKGHIATVQCAEVWCPMTTEFYREYLREKSRKRQMLFVMNPRKLQACQFLIDYHETRGDKTIVFSDNVFALKHYATRLAKPYIYGGTSPAERLRILTQFQHNPAINTIFLSKVGDTSIDIPEATCLIQISSHYGSRRQEAQRLGRILRAKKRGAGGGAGVGVEADAFFYSLVSKDTEEVRYASKRQQFLIDQGYHFKIITKLDGIAELPDLVYSSRAAQIELLNTVLVAGDYDDEDDLPDDKDDLETWRYKAPAASAGPAASVRTAATLQSISGGDSIAYLEFGRGNGAQLAAMAGAGGGRRGKRRKGVVR
ncbi:P-loop containing nucleoside triphosphate hydrolase protein [Geranomyces variabilis]|nr:P-loop containing nucleoside triphosphate hydrolase protein [Geranomyces variabilis]KAJ3141769.1 hypothetical protein HDU90_006112 [Geranomyces variabilis]